MLTLIILVLLAIVFFRLIGFAVRGVFGIAAVLGLLIFFPLLMIGLIVLGLAVIALPILLLVVGISFLAKA